MSLADDLAVAVRSLLAGLPPEAQRSAALPFDEGERRTWVYWPAERRGVPLHELDRAGTKAVHRLLALALPEPVFARAVAIMALDEVLDAREGHRGDRRHRDDYWISLFGDPGGAAWGWRFEGHHVSVHATVVDGEVALTPLFLGANPAVVAEAGRPVLAPLAVEEQLGFELLHALSGEQRSAAMVADVAPDDIVTRNAPSIDASLTVEGVPLRALSGSAASAARALLDVYLARFPAGARRPSADDARFAWAGAEEPGVGHYYRVAGPRLLVELDNTQNEANHVHTVVRDPEGDFGGDVLADHHRAAHGGVGQVGESR
jgi:hypothetical protein